MRIVRTSRHSHVAMPAWIARRDCEEISQSNSHRWSIWLYRRAEILAEYVREAWPSSDVYINLRKNHIAVKVSYPDYDDLIYARRHHLLEEFLDRNDVETLRTRCSVVYRITE